MVLPPKPRITLVEDDPEIARYIQLLLKTSLSAEVSHFSDGLDGLVDILSTPPDLAVLDLDLPSLRGEEICRRLRTSLRTRDLPILVCSSLPEPQRREMELLHIGANAYLEKPFDLDRFLETVRRLLDSAHRTDVTEETVSSTDFSRPALPGGSASLEPPPPLEPDPEAPRPEAEFAGYRIGPIIGGGGMGTVYRAYDPRLRQPVALKVLLRNLTGIPQAVERFLREGRIMASLDHPNIVRVYDSGRTPYSYYIAMELVEGQSLDERLVEGEIAWPRQVEITRDLLEAVVYLHSRGVLHRDLKPSNLLLAKSGPAKLGDFGISRADAFAGDMKLTRDASLVGTPSFMAPEQFQGAEASVTTDIYSLGRCLQTLFEGGRPPLPPRPLYETRPDLPRALSDAIACCTRADPAQRYQSAEEAREEILEACAKKA